LSEFKELLIQVTVRLKGSGDSEIFSLHYNEFCKGLSILDYTV